MDWAAPLVLITAVPAIVLLLLTLNTPFAANSFGRPETFLNIVNVLRFSFCYIITLDCRHDDARGSQC